MGEAKPQSSFSAFVPAGLWLLPGLIGILIVKVGGGGTLANVVGLGLFAVTWLGWARLCLNVPREPEETVPPIFNRLVGTLQLGTAVCGAAMITGIAFASTVDDAVLRNFSFLFQVAGYLTLAGVALGWQLLLVNAYHNRARPRSILRCATDTIDISLAAVLAGVAGVTVLFVLHLTGLNLPKSVYTVASMIVLGALFLWRIVPYILRGLLASRL